jgi:CheY-like chemotaxis protein
MASILVMEDDKLQASVFDRLLTGEGHDVVVTGTASEAVSAIATKEIDLVITDIYVRNESGLTADGGILLIGKIRNARFGIDPKLPKSIASVPIIATTGAGATSYTRIDPLESAQDLGADIVLRKPIDLDELSLSVSHALSQKRS